MGLIKDYGLRPIEISHLTLKDFDLRQNIMSSTGEYEFIISYEEKPEVQRKSKRKVVSTAGLILDELIKADKPIAKILKDNISDKYKNSNACARALGRVIKTRKLENVEAYADVNDDIWIEKTE